LTPLATAAATLTFTGERFLPEVRGPIWYEHWHRYAAVAPLATGKRVVDAACGEGYGSYLLAQRAASVTGIDVAPAAIAHARARYPRDNLLFAEASVTALPLPAASADLVVSFETVEHLLEQEAMIREFRRVLAPDGVLVISSPNRPVYNEGADVENHFHVRELDRAELAALLATQFPQQSWYAQRVLAQSALWAEGAAAGPVAFDTIAGDAPAAQAAPAPPMYFVVVCAAEGVALPALPALSLFDDGTLSLWRDYARALMRERELAWDEVNARAVAEERLAELVVTVNALASARAAETVLRSVARALTEHARGGRALPLLEQAQLRLTIAHVVRGARSVVRDVMDGSGASVHFLDHELQRLLRDVQMISAHTVFDVDLVAEQCGRALLEDDAPLPR